MSTSLATPSAPLPRGFVSVVGYRGAGIVARASGGVIWAHRALPSGPGWHPAPSCLFFPAPDGRLACLFAQRIARDLGWPTVVRRGSAGSRVWQACGLVVPPFAVKVRLPAGMRAAAARQRLAPLYPAFQACLAGGP